MYNLKGRAVDDVIETDDFRAAYRFGIVKRLARALSAPTSTARAMIYQGVWPSRRREVALVLAEQIRKEQRALAVVEAKLARILEEYEHADGRRRNVLPLEDATTSAARGAVGMPRRTGEQSPTALSEAARLVD